MQHPFDQAVHLHPLGEGRYTGATHPAYANMVGPFGGVTGATLLQAVMLHPARLGEPIALTVNFAGPLADGAFEIHARAVRTNRSTQHWSIELSQGGEVAATASAVCAVRRESWGAQEADAPAVPPPESLPRASAENRPPWVNRYDMRFTEGGLPSAFDGEEQPHSTSTLWLRDDPPRPLDFAALAALCDCFYARNFIRRRRRAAIGTITLSTYFHADAAQLAAQGEQYLLGTAQALNYRRGYFDQTARVWGLGGQLLASTHQMVYFKE